MAQIMDKICHSFRFIYMAICEGIRIGYAFIFGRFFAHSLTLVALHFIDVNDNNDVTLPLSPLR